MGFPVYDYRKDIRNILVTPQIRSRFLRMELGQVNKGHTHDLGHEIFLILQGQAEFEIDGEKEVLGPGPVVRGPGRPEPHRAQCGQRAGDHVPFRDAAYPADTYLLDRRGREAAAFRAK